ncbi:hypothetical protein ACOMHN_013246 [Nucella lapillus]
MKAFREYHGSLEPEDVSRYEQDDEDDSGSALGDLEEENELSSSAEEGEERNRQKTEVADDMSELNEQFCEVKNVLFQVRESYIVQRLRAVEEETDKEYLEPLQQLDLERKSRVQLAEMFCERRKQGIQKRFESEELAILQSMENEKWMLREYMTESILEQMRELEEERTSVDLRPVEDKDILDDLAIIKGAVKQRVKKKRSELRL